MSYIHWNCCNLISGSRDSGNSSTGTLSFISSSQFKKIVILRGPVAAAVATSPGGVILSFVSNAHRGDRGATLHHFALAIETQTSSLSLRA
jgi:hypothetical protein